MTLGNYKEYDHIYADGICVSRTSSSDYFPIGVWSEGMSYEGKTVGSVKLKDSSSLPPEALITFFDAPTYPEVMIDIGGTATLADWERFFKDMLYHVQQLKRGKVK